jgi:hypothetical protein
MTEWPFIITLASIICVIAIVLAEQIYTLDLWLYRKWGWSNFADRWEKRKPWWIFVSRMIAGAFAIAGLVTLYTLK